MNSFSAKPGAGILGSSGRRGAFGLAPSCFIWYDAAAMRHVAEAICDDLKQLEEARRVAQAKAINELVKEALRVVQAKAINEQVAQENYRSDIVQEGEYARYFLQVQSLRQQLKLLNRLIRLALRFLEVPLFLHAKPLIERPFYLRHGTHPPTTGAPVYPFSLNSGGCAQAAC